MSEGDGPVGQRVRPLRVLFVCTANISRSPYAEYRARHVLGDAPVEVASAGVPGYPGRGMDPSMLRLLQERGGDGSRHVSQSVSEELLAASDLVLTFEFAQRMRLFDAFPGEASRVFGLGQFAASLARVEDPGLGAELVRQVGRAAVPDSMTLDVTDPYRQGRDVARSIADEIDLVLDRVLPVLAGRELPRLRALVDETPVGPRRAMEGSPGPRRAAEGRRESRDGILASWWRRFGGSPE